MSGESLERPVLVLAALAVAGMVFLAVEYFRAAGALDALEARVSALRPSAGGEKGAGSHGQEPGGGSEGGAGSLHASLRDLEIELEDVRREADGRRPLSGTGEVADVTLANLGPAVESTLAELRREAVERMAVNMSKAMKGGAVRTIEMNMKYLELTEDQQARMNAVFEEESERCRLLLLQTDHHDPGYQEQAREIIERTDARIAEIMSPEQRKKFARIGADFFGPGLDYERKRQPR